MHVRGGRISPLCFQCTLQMTSGAGGVKVAGSPSILPTFNDMQIFREYNYVCYEYY